MTASSSAFPLVVAGVTSAHRIVVEHRRADFAALTERRRLLAVFRERDLAAFRRWFYVAFARRCAKLRALRAAIGAEQRFLAAVGDEIVRTRVPFHVAYQVVRERMPEGADDAGTGDLFDSLFCESAELADETMEASASLSRLPPAEPGEGLRASYRLLVRALHPDRNPSGDARALWNEVQCAYQRRDATRLEALAAFVHMEKLESGAEGLEQAPLCRLQEMGRQLASRVAALDRELEHARSHPAWGFGEPRRGRARSKELRSRAGAALAVAARDARRHLADLRKQARRMSRPPRPTRSRGGDGPQQLTFDF